MVKENAYVLIIAIIKGLTPEKAFERYEIFENRKTKSSQEDVIDMANLHKQGFSWRQIAEMYAITTAGVSNAVRRMEIKEGEQSGKQKK